MGHGKSQDEKRKERFEGYVAKLIDAVGHKDRAGPCRNYCVGLLLPGDRKSMEPIAARIEPEAVSRQHQSIHHFVSKADWDDQSVINVAASNVIPAMQAKEDIAAWIVDDTGIPKKGEHSVGVARQYCGRLGKQDNCQVAVSLSVANSLASVPVAYKLYVPEEWANDKKRREKVGIPEEVNFQRKWQIALDQIRLAKESSWIPKAPVVTDAGYGVVTEFRDGLTSLGFQYMVGIQGHTSVWTSDRNPLPIPPYKGTGRPRKLLRRDKNHKPISVKELAMSLDSRKFKKVSWREGAKGEMTSRFAALRVRPAHEDYWRSELRDEEWLLIEWPQGEKEPTKYWFSTSPKESALTELVGLAKIRWRIERDYEELKGEIGLDHFEGRSWRGFHHHASLCIAAYGFLVRERLFFFRGQAPSGSPIFEETEVPEDYKPRGSREGRKASRNIDRHNALQDCDAFSSLIGPLPLLPPTEIPVNFMTQ